METPYSADLATLAALIAAGGPLETVKVHIATVAPSPMNKEIAVADFTEATFTGATAKAVTWGAPYLGPDGIPQVDTQLLVFTVTATSPGENVVGWYMTDAAGTVLIAADLFDSPLNVPGVGSGFAFVIAYRRYDGLTRVVD